MDLVFRLGTEQIGIQIKGKTVVFARIQGQYLRYAPIEGLRLSIGGILKSHPDLEGKSDGEIKKEGVKRFKEKINSLNSEWEIASYIREDLKKHGYKLKSIRKNGHRTKVIRDDTV